MKKTIRAALLALCLAALAATAANAQYAIPSSAITGGGGTSANGVYSVTGAIGQSLAGGDSTGGTFRVRSGLFNVTPSAPTAAEVVVGGRVRTADGRGIRNVRVTMTDSAGVERVAITTTFGFYRFESVAVGQVYVFRADAKRFNFGVPVQIVNVDEKNFTVDFVAQ